MGPLRIILDRVFLWYLSCSWLRYKGDILATSTWISVSRSPKLNVHLRTIRGKRHGKLCSQPCNLKFTLSSFWLLLFILFCFFIYLGVLVSSFTLYMILLYLYWPMVLFTHAQGAARGLFFRSHEAHFIRWQCHLWLRADSCLRVNPSTPHAFYKGNWLRQRGPELFFSSLQKGFLKPLLRS